MPLLLNPLQHSVLKRYPQGSIYQGFAENPQLYKAATGVAGHNGIDIAVRQPAAIYAATDGVVTIASNDVRGYGMHVRIVSPVLEDGYRYETVYGHMDEITVVFGQTVKKGDIIGYEGNTGFVISNSTPYWGNAPAGKGVHLHFACKRLSDDLSKGFNADYFLAGKYVKLAVLNMNNGFNGYIDPLPLLTDKPEPITLNQKAMDYLERNQNKLVQNAETGAIGIIKGDKVLVTDAERAGLLALTAIIRQGGGGGVTADLWSEFPKEQF